MKTALREWDWWAHLFRVVHRGQIEGIAEWDAALVGYLWHVLELERGRSVLDVGCGSGEHLRGLAEKGARGVGVDVAPSLVRHCRERAEAMGLGRELRFVEGDMRDLASAVAPETFHAATLLSGAFGFFDDATNQAVLDGLAERLEPGGSLVLDCVAPARAPRARERSWSELAGGILLDEAWFDPVTCTRVGDCRYLDPQGVLNLSAQPERIRIYSLPELRAMLGRAGLDLVAAHASHSLPVVPHDAEHARRLVVIGRKPGAG